jgi:hypothetical protein
MVMWRSFDAGWGVAAVRVVMGLIFVGAAWSKVAVGFGAVTANFGKMGCRRLGSRGRSSPCSS